MGVIEASFEDLEGIMSKDKDNVVKFPVVSVKEHVFEEHLQNGDKVLGCAHCEHSSMTIRLDGELFCGSCHAPAGPIDLIVEVLINDHTE